MNFIRRRRLTLRYDFGCHIGLIRDFYKSEEHATWVQIYNAERGW